MNILVIENSTHNLSIALKKHDKIFEQNKLSANSSEYIISMIERLLNKADLDITGIDFFSLGLGPGSFTGLRIACSIIKGFYISLGKPIVGLPSFVALACESTFFDKNIAIISDARKNLIYGAIYKKSEGKIKPVVTEKLLPLEEFLKRFCNKDCVFTGESIKFKESIEKIHPHVFIAENIIYPRAGLLIDEAEQAYLNNNFISLDKLQPLYLHPDVCQVKK